MPYTAQFFAEKLNIPVEYFNPFHNVQIDPSVNLEELARVAHSLGEIVGLGLRNLANCPVEMNLMPDSTLRWQAFNQKKPYFIATVFFMALVAGAVGFLFQELAVGKEKQAEELGPKVSEINERADHFKRAYSQFQTAQDDAGKISAWLDARYYWGDVLSQLRDALIRSESDIKKKYSAQKPDMEPGIWIEQMTTIGNAAANPNAPANTAAPQPAGGTPDQIGAVNLLCRAVDLTGIDAAANGEIAYAVENEFKAVPAFDPKTVQLSSQTSQVGADHTFTFGITVTLQNPPKL
jgi:hypothetical protein